MNNDLNQIINRSIKKLRNCFYKVLTSDNGEKYIIEYTGTTKSVSTLLGEGWSRFPQKFLDDITEESPYFNFNDYKFSNELNEIIRKSNEDLLRKKLNDVQTFIDFDNGTFRILLNHIKSIFNVFNINFLNFNLFDDLLINYKRTVNASSLDINEKTNYLVAMNEYLENIENELKKNGVLNSHKFFNENFKYFLILL